MAAATFGMALAVAALGFAVPQLPLATLVGLATLLALGLGIAGRILFAPKSPAPPATAVGDAVTLVSFGRYRSVLHCVHSAWGSDFARANGAPAVPRRRSSSFARRSWVIGGVVTPAAALFVWAVAHPRVHIDNTGPDALRIWVDGVPSEAVPPYAGDAPPPSIPVAYGWHTLGYSKVGASRPEATIDIDVTMREEHLYNPGTTACYRLVVDRYGSASPDGTAPGLQPRREFYTFRTVDTWFEANPQRVSVSGGEEGATRVALNRTHGCPALEAKASR